MLHTLFVVFLAWHPGLDTATAFGTLFAYLVLYAMVQAIGDLARGELGGMAGGLLFQAVLLTAVWHQPWWTKQQVLTGYAACLAAIVVATVMLTIVMQAWTQPTRRGSLA